METRNKNEPTFESYRPSDEGMHELPSPPRIRRLQNRRRKDDEDESDRDSDRDAHSIQFPMASPPRSISGTNCDISEFRRRLEIVKERRARHTSRSENMSQLSEQAAESNCINYPTTYEQHYHSSMIQDGSLRPSHDASPIEKSKPLAPLNDSPVSTCQTLDEVTLNTTMYSTNLWPTSPSVHRVPSSRCSTDRRPSRKGDCAKKNYLNLRRFMCTSSEKNIDTSFAQITDAICKTNRANTSNDQVNQNLCKTTNADDTSGDHEYLGAGEFQGNLASSSTAPRDVPGNRLLDRLFCASALSSSSRRTHIESSSPSPNRLSSSLLFGVPNKHGNEDECEGFQHGFPSNNMISPGHSRRFHRKTLRTEIPPTCHELHAGSENRGIPSRNSSPFSWNRKDPWYLNSSSYKEGNGEIATDVGKTSNEILERMMHAVVFVKGKCN